MSFGSRARALVTRMITDGDKWTHEATFTYGPRQTKANKWEEATAGAAINPQTLQVAAFPIESAIEDGGVKIEMWEIYVPAASILVRPTEEDTVTLDGVRNNIIDVSPIGANATDAVYIVRARR